MVERFTSTIPNNSGTTRRAPVRSGSISGVETAALCFAETGAFPVRPHMLVFNTRGNTHAIMSFVASGHVVFFNAETRRPLRCFRTEVGAGGARQAHAIWPTPGDRYLLVANQNGKKFERIRTNYRHDEFEQEPEATLDLANCTTPNGMPCQDPLLRPDNAPICPFVPERGFPAYASLRGGGMLAFNPYTTPMSIVAEYDAATIPRDGCGFVEAKGWVYGNGGGGNVANPDGWFIYRVPGGGPKVLFAGQSAQPPGTAADRPRRSRAAGRPRRGEDPGREVRVVFRSRGQRRGDLPCRDRPVRRHAQSGGPENLAGPDTGFSGRIA